MGHIEKPWVKWRYSSFMKCRVEGRAAKRPASCEAFQVARAARESPAGSCDTPTHIGSSSHGRNTFNASGTMKPAMPIKATTHDEKHGQANGTCTSRSVPRNPYPLLVPASGLDAGRATDHQPVVTTGIYRAVQGDAGDVFCGFRVRVCRSKS